MDLFRELCRYYPLAKVRTYFANGRWDKRQLVTDTTLFMVHREEGGAPPPLDLEDVPVPELPSSGYGGQTQSSTTSRRGPAPPSVPSARGPPSRSPPEAPRRPLTPAPPKTAPPARAFAAQGADPRPAPSEGRMIQNFVDKWGLDATRTKLMFSRLLPSKRQMVLENFPGGGADDLRQYIARCEREKSWGGGGTKRGHSPTPAERNTRARFDAAYRGSPRDTAAADAHKQRGAPARASYGSSTAKRAPPGGSDRYPPSSAGRAGYGSAGAARSAPARGAPKPSSMPKTTPTPSPKPSDRPGDLIKNLLGNLGI